MQPFASRHLLSDFVEGDAVSATALGGIHRAVRSIDQTLERLFALEHRHAKRGGHWNLRAGCVLELERLDRCAKPLRGHGDTTRSGARECDRSSAPIAAIA